MSQPLAQQAQQCRFQGSRAPPASSSAAAWPCRPGAPATRHGQGVGVRWAPAHVTAACSGVPPGGPAPGRLAFCPPPCPATTPADAHTGPRGAHHVHLEVQLLGHHQLIARLGLDPAQAAAHAPGGGGGRLLFDTAMHFTRAHLLAQHPRVCAPAAAHAPPPPPGQSAGMAGGARPWAAFAACCLGCGGARTLTRAWHPSRPPCPQSSPGSSCCSA